MTQRMNTWIDGYEESSRKEIVERKYKIPLIKSTCPNSIDLYVTNHVTKMIL